MTPGPQHPAGAGRTIGRERPRAGWEADPRIVYPML